jgi:hypothetical protein
MARKPATGEKREVRGKEERRGEGDEGRGGQRDVEGVGEWEGRGRGEGGGGAEIRGSSDDVDECEGDCSVNTMDHQGTPRNTKEHQGTPRNTMEEEWCEVDCSLTLTVDGGLAWQV